MTILIAVVSLLFVGAFVIFGLPKMPHLAQVGFWVVLTVVQIVDGNALLSAIYAAIAMSTWDAET